VAGGQLVPPQTQAKSIGARIWVSTRTGNYGLWPKGYFTLEMSRAHLTCGNGVIMEWRPEM